ncbi:MAG: N-acetyltransferase [Zoogloeaceae bacterium]|nr:N-acetyltransferase [Zoogloeaceae bacterium]
MEWSREENRIYARDAAGKLLAEVTFPALETLKKSFPKEALAKLTPISGEEKRGVVVIDHTFVDDSLRGQGRAGELMLACREELLASGRAAIPLCPYAVAWFKKHPEKADVVALKD